LQHGHGRRQVRDLPHFVIQYEFDGIGHKEER
jgi:hypothetical protein